MNTIWVVPIEPIDQRYTRQWYENIPDMLESAIKSQNLPFRVDVIDGDTVPDRTTEGAFLDFGATNFYKATQAAAISHLFMTGQVQAGDRFLVTDAWNFVVTPIRYMSDLLDIPVEIHGIWHAGAYDPTDILGLKMSKPWPWVQEQAWFMAMDYSYFATQFHLDMFAYNLGIDKSMWGHKLIRSGQPHEPIVPGLETYQKVPKNKRVIWPHRYNDDKQPEIAEDLAQDFDMLITQKQNLSKADYYAELGRCQIIFSCALHENLGISVMEATLSGAIPVLPDRCSYSEMYLPEFKYPSAWTQNYTMYETHRADLVAFIRERLDNPDRYAEALAQQQTILKNGYLTADIMYANLLAQRGDRENGNSQEN
jgi:hypothetical protein